MRLLIYNIWLTIDEQIINLIFDDRSLIIMEHQEITPNQERKYI